MQLNCRILDSRLTYHDEGTLTGSEFVFSEDTDTVMKLKAQWWKQKLILYKQIVYKMEWISI